MTLGLLGPLLSDGPQMSSVIEFRHLAISLPISRALAAIRSIIPEAPGFYDFGADGQLYFTFAEAGCSNVFDTGVSNRIARRWHLAAVGSPYMVLRTASRTAADDVLGGCVCLRTRARWTRPEAYIAAYRTAMERALPFDALAAAEPTLSLELNLPASIDYQQPWSAREDYRQHLRRAGRLTGSDQGGTFHAAPFGCDDGVADLTWLSTLGMDSFPPAWMVNDRAVNEALDWLADTVKISRRS